MTLFTKIFNQQLPGFLISESEHSFVILDKYPLRGGHLLVIPKREIPAVWDLPLAEYQDLMELAKKMAPLIKKITNCNRVGMVVEGFGVQDHAHIHLIPINAGGQLELDDGSEMTDDELNKWQIKFKEIQAQN